MLCEAALDRDLVTRFDDLFERFYGQMFGLVYRVLGDRADAEEVLQEAFLRLARSDVQARPDEEVAAWLRRVGLNLAFNRGRDQRRARDGVERIGQLGAAEPAQPDDPDRVVVRHEEQREVRRALAALPERQRACLLLRHAGYSYLEIAATLGVAVGSVGVLLSRAERAFRESYESYQERAHDRS